MAEERKKNAAENAADTAELSARLQAATGNIERVSADTLARQTEQKKNERKSASDAKARAKGSEKQRREDDARRDIEAANRIAELEYAEDYRKKLQRERRRALAEAKEVREAAEAKAREQRAKEVAEILESERREAMERGNRADALLDKLARSRAERAEALAVGEKAEAELKAVEADMAEEASNEAENNAACEDVKAQENEEAAPPVAESDSQAADALAADGAEKILIDIQDDRMLLNIGPDGSFYRIEEIAESSGAEQVAAEETVSENNDEQIVGDYPDPGLSSNPIVASIQTLGKSVYSTSTYRKYTDKSRAAVKELKRIVAESSENAMLVSGEEGAAANAIVDAIKAAGAIIEIRCDNLRLAAKFGQKSALAISDELHKDVERYNSKVAEFAAYTGEKLTRISRELPSRVTQGTGLEIIPELYYTERYIEYNGEYAGERTRSYVITINEGIDEPEVERERKTATKGTYIVKPVIPAISATELLRGAYVYDEKSYKRYLKLAKSITKAIDKATKRTSMGMVLVEEESAKLERKMDSQRKAIDLALAEMRLRIDDAKDVVFRKTLAILEGKRAKYEKNEKKLELNRTFMEDEGRRRSVIINCFALRREKLILAFNTLSAAVISCNPKYISQAKSDLHNEIVRYNLDAEDCAKAIGIPVTPLRASLVDDILEGKGCVDIPRIAVLRELVEKVGDEARTIGKCETAASYASCTFVIKTKSNDNPSEKKGVPGVLAGSSPAQRSGVRTVHGNFFIGGTAHNGAESGLADALVTGAVIAGPMMAASGSETADPGAMAATALAFGTAAKASGMPGVLGESGAAETDVTETAVASASAAEAAPAVAPVAVVDDKAAVNEAAPVVEPASVKEPVSDESEFAFTPGVFGFNEAQTDAPDSLDAETAEILAEKTPAYMLETTDESPFEIHEVVDGESAEAGFAAAEVDMSDAPEAPIEELTPRMLVKTVRDENGDETIVETPYVEELVDDGDGTEIPMSDEELFAEDIYDGPRPIDLTSDEGIPEDDVIRLVPLSPPEEMEGGEIGEAPIGGGYPYPGNEIHHRDPAKYYDPDDISNLPPVIEIDDNSDAVESDFLTKPTKRGLRKHLAYITKKIKRASHERSRLMRLKRSEKSVVPKVKHLISILKVQKEIIDLYCNALSAAVDVGAKRRARSLASKLRAELKRYNKFVKEYERLTDDRLTKASLDIPAAILEGEDYQILPKVKLREFEAPENGVVYEDGITEIADYEADYFDDETMTAKELASRLQKDDRELSRLRAEFNKKTKAKNDTWGISRTILVAESFAIQKKIIDTLASDLHAACQVSSVKNVQSIKKELGYEIKQYNRLVNEYKAATGNNLTPASESIPQDIISGKTYTPVPRVGCVHGMDSELEADINSMSRNVYGVEDEDVGAAGRAAFRTQVTAQANKDLTLMTRRADYQVSMLESERDILDYRFGKEPSQIKREKRSITKRIDKIRAEHKTALRYENNDNRRYYAVVTSNPRTMVLYSKHADRTRIAALRSKIISLLNERDIINGKLMAIYGGEGQQTLGSINQTWRRIKNNAAQKAKKKQKSLANAVKSLPITLKEKERFYDLMNKKIDAESTLALIKYRIKKEKMHSEDKICARHDIKELRSRVKRIENDIRDLMKSTKQRLSEIEAGTTWMIAFIFIIILAIAGVALYVHWFGDSFTQMFNILG